MDILGFLNDSDDSTDFKKLVKVSQLNTCFWS